MSEKISTGPFHRFSFKPPEGLTSWSRSAKSDKYFVTFFIVWISVVILTSLAILVAFRTLPAQIPLFYGRIWGESQLAPRMFIYLPIGGAGFLGLFNLAMGVNLHQQDKSISYLLAGTSSLTSILAAITTVNIIRLFL